MEHYDNFIGGKFVPSNSTERMEVRNPSNGQIICTVPESSRADIEMAIAAAEAAQREWAKLPAVERAKPLRSVATRIRQGTEQIARIISEEQGKTLSLARVEVGFTADYIDYMAEWACRIEGEILESDRPGESIFLFRQPIGAVGGILSWNFPFFLIARKAAPALVAGNTIVIKPSEETPHNAVKFCELLDEAGVPPGVINVVHGRGPTVGKALASSRASAPAGGCASTIAVTQRCVLFMLIPHRDISGVVRSRRRFMSAALTTMRVSHVEKLDLPSNDRRFA